MNYEDLTPEQQARVKDCETLEEILAVAKNECIELTDEEVESIAGGGWAGSGEKSACPKCGSKALENDPCGWHCMDCGYSWT